MDDKELERTIESCMDSPLLEVESGREVGKDEILRIMLDVKGYLPVNKNDQYGSESGISLDGIDLKMGYYGSIFIGTRREYLTWFWKECFGSNYGKIIGEHYTLNSNKLELREK